MERNKPPPLLLCLTDKIETEKVFMIFTFCRPSNLCKEKNTKKKLNKENNSNCMKFAFACERNVKILSKTSSSMWTQFCNQSLR